MGSRLFTPPPARQGKGAFITVCVVAAIIGCIGIGIIISYFKYGSFADGKVTAVRYTQNAKTGDMQYVMTAEFEADGKTYSVTASWGSDFAQKAVGDSVGVRYNKHNPNEADLNGQGLPAVGIGFFVISVMLVVTVLCSRAANNRRYDRFHNILNGWTEAVAGEAQKGEDGVLVTKETVQDAAVVTEKSDADEYCVTLIIGDYNFRRYMPNKEQAVRYAQYAKYKATQVLAGRMKDKALEKWFARFAFAHAR